MQRQAHPLISVSNAEVSSTYRALLTRAILLAAGQQPLCQQFATPTPTQHPDGILGHRDHPNRLAIINSHQRVAFTDLITLTNRCGDNGLPAFGHRSLQVVLQFEIYMYIRIIQDAIRNYKTFQKFT